MVSHSSSNTIQRLLQLIIASFIVCIWIVQQNPPPNTADGKHRDHIRPTLPFSVDPIDCKNVPMDKEPHYTVQQYPNISKSAVVDHAPWSVHQEIVMKDSLLDQQILNVAPNELFIDVGANIGQMLLSGLIGDITTMAFDPLEYDITKICTGVKETIARGLMPAASMDKLHLFRAVVGNESKENVTITRPDDSFGKFEQASLFKDTIGVVRKPKTLVEEVVPMLKLDDMVPTNLPVGLVKIDVQGFEWPVVQGMKGLLERKSGYPKIVHYEEQARVTTLAGFQLGTVQSFLEGYGYVCTRLESDINCVKQ